VAFDPQSLTFTATVGDVVVSFFSDGFEEESGWSFAPFWNRSTLETDGQPFLNQAFLQEYVSLASDDASGGALPSPFTGDFALWYGEPSAGNFIGTQIEEGPGTGGTSTAPNGGDAESPEFLIPASASAAVLRFDTWFEIEGVNPIGFDIMSILVSEDGSETLVGTLNPISLPVFGEPPIPFTTRGLDLAPAWQERAFDLSAFKGKTVSLIFRFATGDHQYNGFRGWLIDDVRVNSDPLPSFLRRAPPAPATAKGVRAPGPKLRR
jgi:hypothetical protein